MTFIGNKIASKPRDDDHNLGHGKAEYSNQIGNGRGWRRSVSDSPNPARRRKAALT